MLASPFGFRVAKDRIMTAFILLTKLKSAAVESPEDLLPIEQRVMEHIRMACPDVAWETSFAVFGPYDYIDIFHAPDVETAMKVSTIIRTFGHAETEIWGAVEWNRFKEIISDAGTSSAESLSRQRQTVFRS